MGRPTVVVEERARPASMERSSIVPSFAWMERLHYALARLALFPFLSSDPLPRDEGGAGKLPERKQTNPYAVRAGGRRIRRCVCVADFNRVQDVHRDREEYGMLQRPCTDGREGVAGLCGWYAWLLRSCGLAAPTNRGFPGLHGLVGTREALRIIPPAQRASVA